MKSGTVSDSSQMNPRHVVGGLSHKSELSIFVDLKSMEDSRGRAVLGEDKIQGVAL